MSPRREQNCKTHQVSFTFNNYTYVVTGPASEWHHAPRTLIDLLISLKFIETFRNDDIEIIKSFSISPAQRASARCKKFWWLEVKLKSRRNEMIELAVMALNVANWKAFNDMWSSKKLLHFLSAAAVRVQHSDSLLIATKQQRREHKSRSMRANDFFWSNYTIENMEKLVHRVREK